MDVNLLSYYYGLIAQKEEEVRRLQDARTKLLGYKDELAGYRNLFFQPELSSNTWSGELAEGFESVRSTLQSAYDELKESQFLHVFLAIAAKISELQSQIQYYNSCIDSIRSDLALER
ncbi:YwqH-like family protein [Peribacillus deserti]|uniref:DUF5082 domain-containing protein n=1 Tax=Peribacillus deserti TaxID=673318 RepID=A0A2N5M8W2_9BACI|nr:DUF5082 family protein [Peribacillus deserti]PLT30787.1 DUF5082 domain-containing protein [Peribacillus deserti]